MVRFDKSQMTKSQFARKRVADMDVKFADFRFEVAHYSLMTLLQKYDPDQPRDDQGRWTDGSASDATNANSSGSEFGFSRFASYSNIAACNAQYRKDLFQCKMVGLPQCYAQAMVRLVACENGSQIPPLNY